MIPNKLLLSLFIGSVSRVRSLIGLCNGTNAMAFTGLLSTTFYSHLPQPQRSLWCLLAMLMFRTPEEGIQSVLFALLDEKVRSCSGTVRIRFLIVQFLKLNCLSDEFSSPSGRYDAFGEELNRLEREENREKIVGKGKITLRQVKLEPHSRSAEWRSESNLSKRGCIEVPM